MCYADGNGEMPFMENVRAKTDWVIWYKVSCFMYPFIVYKIVNIYVFEASNMRRTTTTTRTYEKPEAHLNIIYEIYFIRGENLFILGERTSRHTHTQ